MNKKLLVICSIILIILLCFTGCFEPEAVKTEKQFENINFSSDIVELTYGKIEYVSDEGKVKRVDVKYLFKNLLDRNINIYIYVKFYDKIDNLVETSEKKEMILPPGYKEMGLGPANTISYKGDLISKIDHVEIIVEEMT